MSIASELTALNTDIVNARAAVTAKGGTVTTGGGSSQLAADIASIPAGGANLEDVNVYILDFINDSITMTAGGKSTYGSFFTT